MFLRTLPQTVKQSRAWEACGSHPEWLGASHDGHAVENVGAWILGSNMFAPSRGPWTDDSWKGWWGDAPPYDCPVYVLTHHERPDLEMSNNTTFHFITTGIRDALERAQRAAGPKDVRIGGGANTIRQFLSEGLIDEMHLAIAPVLLGRGEPLLTGLDLPSLGYACVTHEASAAATHVVVKRARANHPR